jgi:hypothetical protein
MAERFTVLLLRPDYAADTYGHDTYLAYVDADTVEEAITFARADLESEVEVPDDLHVLLVARGHIEDVKP